MSTENKRRRPHIKSRHRILLADYVREVGEAYVSGAISAQDIADKFNAAHETQISRTTALNHLRIFGFVKDSQVTRLKKQIAELTEKLAQKEGK